MSRFAVGGWNLSGGEGAGNVPAIAAVQWRLDSLRNEVLVRPTNLCHSRRCHAGFCLVSGVFYERLISVLSSVCHSHSAVMW